MTFRSFAAMACFISAGSSAMADVSAVQVWEDFLQGIKSSGSTVSVIQDRSAGQVALDDFLVRYQDPDVGFSLDVDIGQAAFVENSDGSVSINLPRQIPVTMEFRDNYSQVTAISVLLETENMRALASGSSSQITYDYSADQMALSLQSLIGEGERIGADEVQFSIVADQVSSTATTFISGLREVIGRSSVGTLELSGLLAPQGEDFNATWMSKIRQLSFANSSQTPENVSVQELSKALQAGLNSSSVISYQSGETEIMVRTPDGDFSGSTRSTGASSNTSMSKDGLSMLMDVSGVDFEAFASVFPLPISGQLGSFVYGLTMPVLPHSEDQAFGLRFELNELAVPDGLWAMFDPAGQLPRDPVSVRFDVGGMVKLWMDFLDPDQLEASLDMMEVPGEVSQITLNAIDVSALGAELSVQGAFDINNENLSTFDGFPAPQGKATATLSGANALLDTLSQMGIIAGEQVMGARMFMGMFALPVGRDKFETEVEIDAEGGVYVNQQRFQ